MIKKTHFAKRQIPDRCALMGMGKYFFKSKSQNSFYSDFIVNFQI